MNILVTGAAGAVGSHVAEALAHAGHNVRGLDFFTPYYPRALKEINREDVVQAGAQFFEVDLASDDLAQYVAGADVVYHFAAQPGISQTTSFEDYVRNNITATYRLLEALIQDENKALLVHISTSSVYGKHALGDEAALPQPASHYGVTKLASEQLALSYWRERGLPVTVLRLFSVYGERERPEKLYHKLIKAISSGEPFPLYEGAEHHLRSYTYVGDIVTGCLAVLAHRGEVEGEVFNLGNDKAITTGEGIRIIEAIMGKKMRVLPQPRRPGDQLQTGARIEKAQRVLGYNPQVAPEEGLRREVEWYKAKINGRV